MVCRGCPRHRERNTQDCIGPQTGLVRCPVEFAQLLVQCLLVVGIESVNDLLNLSVHVVSRVQYALAPVPFFVSVAEFDGFPLAG